MTCLNLKLPYLVAYDPKDPKIHWVEQALGKKLRESQEKDFYYVQVSCHNSLGSFEITEYIPEDILEKIKQGQVDLVIDNALEPFLGTVDSIYQTLVMKNDISPKSIVFMAAVPNMLDYVKQAAKKYNKDEIRIELFQMFEFNLHEYMNKVHIKDVPTLHRKIYNKKFICLNRRWRLHRPLMMTLLHDKRLLSKGHISFGQSDFPMDTWDLKWREMETYYQGHDEILQILDRNHNVKTLPDLYLDTVDLVTNRADPEDTIDPYYETTYFSVVNETTYHTKPGYDSAPFFSEKIFKAIAMRHPFIVATVPNSLQYLKKMGYQTFAPLIDETYDSIEDDGDRMIAIVDEIEKLCDLKGPALDHFLINCKLICEHNYQTLINRKQFIFPMN